MIKTTKKTLALLLAVLQLFALLPTLTPAAKAEQRKTATPALNETIVGTLQFQAFNFLGENTTGAGRNQYSDGEDYTSTFYYTDDYFAPSAINEKATKTTMLWSDLDNTHLAACSAAFAFASFTSNIGNVVSNTAYSGKGSWENTEYGNKDSNVKNFLGQCKFEHVETFGLTEKPTIDSIGYTIGHKTITVWDEESKTNRNYTLIAVGVRGAGYDSEWASNVTIGNPNSAAHEMPNGRHWGFNNSAVTVCSSIRQYLDDNHITGDVKYWVTGFSRAAAVANLVAGYLTDNGDTYLTKQKNVFAYTWECPQAASTSENALDYKNIYNIINPMDAVPKVSPSQFGHQRLGVDYQMPYYKNMPNQGTTTSDKNLNKNYYERMQAVLETIATAKKSDGSADPVVTAVANYPYNEPVTPYTITARQLISDAGNDSLAQNFGTVVAEKKTYNWIGIQTGGNVDSVLGGGKWYMDQFIDNLIQVFLESDAWNGQVGQSSTALSNRTRFINNYQVQFRNLLGYFLDFSGPAFLGILPQLINAVGDQIGSISLTNWWNNTGFALNFAGFYLGGTELFRSGLISSAQTLAVNIANNMTADYPDRANQSGVTRAQMNTALRKAVELIINLYAYEKDEYGSQYFGTSLHFLNEILCTHLQETVLSWIMSLDSNHMNRNCRTILIPATCSAKLLEFRPEYRQYDGEMEDADAAAPVVVELENGQFTLKKDDRISVIPSGSTGYVTVRYPASLDIRVDVTPAEDLDLRYGAIATDDYRPGTQTFDVSAGPSQYQRALSSNSTPGTDGYSYVTENPMYSNARATNSLINGYGTLEAGDTLHVIADGTDTYSEKMTYTLLVDKAPTTVIADYASGNGLTTGDSADNAVTLGGVRKNKSETVINQIRTRTTENVVPASSIYYDDELTGNSTVGYESNTTRLDQADAGKTVWFKFRGSRIDVYCTTSDTAGYVQAAVTDESGQILTVNGRRMVVTMKNASDTTRYNVPTISFDGLNANTDYYLKLYIFKDSNYCLDGIRVYHSADETDAAVQTAYESVGEQDAKYVNLRALLLGSVSEEALSGNVAEGAVFYTDSGESYSLTSNEYQTNSPKNEIYLKTDESVAFQIVGTYEKVAVGMSAPDSKTGGGSVTVTNGEGTKTQPIVNALDQYYSVTPASDGSVMITNSGNDLISITNVKLSGDYTAPVSGQSLDVPLIVSKSLMRYAVSFSELPDTTPEEHEIPLEIPAPTEEPTMTPTPSSTPEATPVPTLTPTPANPNSDTSLMQLISSFVKSLFSGFSRLFRP